ncbi:hypothetical protein YC2023_121747 [Brassica napus]
MAGAEQLQRWSLRAKTALVTGGTKGIGHAVVEELARFGAIIHTCGRDESQLNECISHWQKKGFHVTGSVCDVTSRTDREKLMETVSSMFGGKLDILINNVGAIRSKPTVEHTADDFSFHISTNLESAFHLSQLSHPLLKASGCGSIVFMSSVAGVVSLSISSIYCATKGAMNQLARNLACEWASDGIRANAVAPAVIATPLAKAVYDDDFKKAVTSRKPLGRFGEPEEVASLNETLPIWYIINLQIYIQTRKTDIKYLSKQKYLMCRSKGVM